MQIFNEISINPEHGTSIIYQLKEQITWLMASGKLKEGDKLPPIKEMAKRLGINLQTVRVAYLRLEADGLVTSRQGRGTHVTAFNPLQFAQLSATQRTHTIGVIIPSWTNPFYHGILQGVEEVTEADGSLLLLSNAHDNPHAAWRHFSMLTARGVDGILIISHDVSEYLESTPLEKGVMPGIPFVTVDFLKKGDYSIALDLHSAGYQAGKHLLEHGYKTPGLITFNPHSENVKPIIEGYEQALREGNRQLWSECVAIVPDFSLASGEDAAKRLMALKNRPDAIFAIADLLALGAMKAIRSLGYSIPADIALISFNDIPTASLVEPRLTSVAIPAVELGRDAMKMLKTLMEGQLPAKAHITMPVKLMVRESCGTHSVESKGDQQNKNQ